MDEATVLRAAALVGLVEGSAEPIELAAADGDNVAMRARLDGMSGFVSAAIDTDVIEADPVTHGKINDGWHEALLGVTLVEALAVRTAAQLDAAGVRWRLTKGAAVAHLDYRHQLAHRTFGDVDVAVHPDDWHGALDALVALGHTRPSPELRPGWDVRFGKGATMIDANDLEIDLHLRFAVGRFGVLSHMEDLFERQDTIELAGRTIPTLAGPDRLLHACHHLVLGGFSEWRVARDVAQLLLISEVDWRETVAVADRWGVEAVVASGIAETWRRLGLDVSHPAHDWAAKHPIGRRDARAIAVFSSHRPFREQALTAIGALSPTRVPSYLWKLTVPTREARHGRSIGQHLRSRVREITRRRG